MLKNRQKAHPVKTWRSGEASLQEEERLKGFHSHLHFIIKGKILEEEMNEL